MNVVEHVRHLQDTRHPSLQGNEVGGNQLKMISDSEYEQVKMKVEPNKVEKSFIKKPFSPQGCDQS